MLKREGKLRQTRSDRFRLIADMADNRIKRTATE
jgi:hypothetical protein